MGTMETIGLHLEGRAGAPEFYVWEVPDKPIAIHLHYDVIDRMLQEVMRGFGLIPKRGAEVGGILLGSVSHGENLTVRIEDFQPVECEHSRGPSYLLAEADVKNFESTLDRWRTGGERQAIGYYRSHTRDGLGLSEEDLDLLRNYFPSPSDIALLIKPFATKASVAGFFFREKGAYQSEASYREFPFRRKELGGGSAPFSRAGEDPPAPNGQGDEPAGFEAEMREAILRDAEPQPARQAEGGSSSSALKPRWVWLPLSFVFLLLGTLLGFQASIAMRGRAAFPQAPQAYSLALTASRNGSSLHIQWDRQAPAVRESKRGVLEIAEGDYRKRLDLDTTQLQNGSVVYLNLSGAVQLRMEVYPGDRNTVIETLEVPR